MGSRKPRRTLIPPRVPKGIRDTTRVRGRRTCPAIAREQATIRRQAIRTAIAKQTLGELRRPVRLLRKRTKRARRQWAREKENVSSAKQTYGADEKKTHKGEMTMDKPGSAADTGRGKRHFKIRNVR